MGFSIFPKETKFFDLFDRQADDILKASKFFKEMIESGRFDDVSALRMHDIEHECDVNTHDIMEKLNRTFITPFDREDIHALAHEVDDIVDMIYSLTKRLNVYQISGRDDGLSRFAVYIEDSTIHIAAALRGLRDRKDTRAIYDRCIEVNKLENAGDVLKDAMVKDLLAKNPDPIHFIKWKELYEGAETVLDICEDVTNVIEAILVKQG